MSKIHPTAVIDSSARIGDDAEIGPWCVVEADVTLGARCVLRPHVVVRRYTSMGTDNHVDSFTVLGGEPQDLKFDPATVSYLQIGDHNVFREGVTISRATTPDSATRVGNHTYWMTASHAGHDATVEDNVILINGAAIAGHATVQRGAILSAHAGVHQFCWIGEMVMAQGHASLNTHVTPYTMVVGLSNAIGLNTVGMRRAGIGAPERQEVKDAFTILYRSGLTVGGALDEMDKHAEWGEAAGKFREFVRKVINAKRPFKRPLCKHRGGGTQDEE